MRRQVFPVRLTQVNQNLSLRTRGAIAAGLPLLLVAALVLALGHASSRVGDLDRRLHNTAQLHIVTLRLHRLASEAESAVRGYRLLGGVSQEFLGPFFRALREVPGDLAELRRFAAEHPEMTERVELLRTTMTERIELLADLRRLPTRPPDNSDGPLLRLVHEGNAVSRELGRQLEDMAQAEARELGRLEASVEAWRTLQWLLWGGLTLALIVGMGLTWRFTRYITCGVEALQRNTERLSTGQALEPVLLRDDELGRLSAALHDAAELLERRERARERAQREAERANLAKTEFLSRMSHELRTPLTAVLGFSELLEMEELSDEQRDSVRHIRRGGRHLLTLINEVLDIARIESGQLAVSLEPVSLASLVHDALALMVPLAAERNVTFRPFPSTQPLFVRADRQRLTQVVLNLLSNAVKYNREGGTVEVRARVVGRLVRLSIRDTGIGIAPELLPRVFQPFDRLGAEGSGVEGTGVGLALSKGLVEAMGGRLTLYSVPDEGTTFTVTLPLEQAPAAETAEPSEPAERGANARDVTVLYVEDNSANIDLLTALLGRHEGVELITTMQGRLALDLARAHGPDLVLLDLHLPDIDGELVLRRLKEDHQTRDIPVVMLTADATSGQERRLRAAGAADYLTKPLDFDRLLGLLRLVRERVE